MDINLLLKNGLGFAMHNSREQMLQNDEEYLAAGNKLLAVFEEYEKLDVTTEQWELINKYINKKEAVSEIEMRASYFAGVRDTIILFKKLGFIS